MKEDTKLIVFLVPTVMVWTFLLHEISVDGLWISDSGCQ